MKKKIVVEYGEQVAISKIMGCTVETVCRALAYRKNSHLARKIRKLALARGGVEIEFGSAKKQVI